MSLNDTPRADRLHIGIFGRRNSGKSSLINRLTGQEIAIVSDTPGTTADPVYKSMELHPVGPVVFVDTAGYDDEGELGAERVRRAKNVLEKTDIALIVLDPATGLGDLEKNLKTTLREREIPCLTVVTKADLAPCTVEGALSVSSKTGAGVRELKEALARLRPSNIS